MGHGSPYLTPEDSPFSLSAGLRCYEEMLAESLPGAADREAQPRAGLAAGGEGHFVCLPSFLAEWPWVIRDHIEWFRTQLPTVSFLAGSAASENKWYPDPRNGALAPRLELLPEAVFFFFNVSANFCHQFR